MRRILLSLLLAACDPAIAQRPIVTKIDPPNWYAAFPKPMLFLKGEHLEGASITLSDPTLKIERTEISANGHWAQIWLAASPAKPLTIKLSLRTPAGQTSAPFTFAARRPAASGMAGFSGKDVMYLIVTDRFADGNPLNDGPHARSAASSPEAAAERGKVRGWHGGDLPGITAHLDYLRTLGVTSVWPTPVYQNHGPEAFHGYHATDYYSVDEHYGTLADLQTLAQSLHARGMKLILDTVPNHVGPFHPWIDDEPTPTWFHGTKASHIPGETHFDALIDPHSVPARTDSTLNGWFVDLLPDMNTDDPDVALYLRQNAVWWIEQTGADALRIDTFSYVDRPFWHAFTAELNSLYPNLTEVGEVSSPDPEITSAFAGGSTRGGAVDTGLYTPFDFPFFHAVRDVFAGTAPFTRIARVLASDELYPHPERLVPFLGNHDESRLAEDVTDPALRRVAYALLLTSRGTPQLYAGDELAQRGANDPDNRHDFPGGFPAAFPPDTPSAFNPSGRNATEEQEFNAIQQLLKLRRAHPALQLGEEQILHADADTFVYLRTLGSEKILIALNKSHTSHSLSIPLATAHQATALQGDNPSISAGTLNLTLAPISATISTVQ